MEPMNRILLPSHHFFHLRIPELNKRLVLYSCSSLVCSFLFYAIFLFLYFFYCLHIFVVFFLLISSLALTFYYCLQDLLGLLSVEANIQFSSDTFSQAKCKESTTNKYVFAWTELNDLLLQVAPSLFLSSYTYIE